MRKRTIIYRGNLKSCNYRCSYCPFAKHRALPVEMEKDRQSFVRFCDSIEKRVQTFSIGAVFIAPYGEATIHHWYWEGLSRLAEIVEIDRVGMQTNLSFSVEERLKGFAYAHKLCIWATFHPEMTTVDEFVSKCHQLVKNNVMVCAGAVGVPENLPLLRELREKLSPVIYLWINKMDGLKRNYRPNEIEAFVQLDPFFAYELKHPDAAVQMCADRCFVEADGKIHTCNISRTKEINWYDGSEEEIFEPVCSRKSCTCYLAYGGRADFALRSIFGEYPIYRIPEKFRAIFFDLDGTLMTNIMSMEPGMSTGNRHGQQGLSVRVREKLAALREVCPIFLATSMPEVDVKRRLKSDMDLFKGFIFASGGYLCLREEKGQKEKVYSIDISSLSEVIEFGESRKAKYVVYRKNGAVYKVTLVKGHHSVWKDAEYDRMTELLKGLNCRFFMEGNCLQIVSRGRDKGAGIEEMCGWLGISAGDVLAVGNDKEDAAMERVCGAYLEV